MPSSCLTFRQKAYFSQYREANIFVDVSIEVFISGANHPAIVWVWECKDYSHAVPVDDVEEFHAKLQQIGADRTKGTIISRGPFQSGALAYARANGIGLARFQAAKIDWVLQKPPDARDRDLGELLLQHDDDLYPGVVALDPSHDGYSGSLERYVMSLAHHLCSNLDISS